MVEPTKIEERLISGRGALKVPDAGAKARFLTLYLDLIRPPTNRYENFNYNPPRGRLATFTYLRNGYVLGEDEMVYDAEIRDSIADISGQTLIALKCAYEGILTSFANLGTALGLTLTQYTDQIKDYENLNLRWDTIKFVCYADTAIQVRLYSLDYQTCSPSKDKQQKPPPPPPPLPQLPPGTGTPDISDPYEGDDTDNPDTLPHPIDRDAEPPPDPNECTTKTVTIVWTQLFGNQAGTVSTFSDTGTMPYRIFTNDRTFARLDFGICADGAFTGFYVNGSSFISFSGDDGSTVWFRIDSVTVS